MKVGATGQVVLSDINAAMLSEGRKKMCGVFHKKPLYNYF
jgi:ubiquinone/menaquinone biosynthesis C-methylase UbiE